MELAEHNHEDFTPKDAFFNPQDKPVYYQDCEKCAQLSLLQQIVDDLKKRRDCYYERMSHAFDNDMKNNCIIYETVRQEIDGLIKEYEAIIERSNQDD